MKALGLTEGTKKVSRGDAVQRAAAAPKPELPMDLGSGVRVLRWVWLTNPCMTGQALP
jgi:hypothetical protein